MKLDRNLNEDGTGKYALVLLRRVNNIPKTRIKKVDDALKVLESAGVLDYGPQGPSDGGGQFFVMRYRDEFTAAGLRAYAKAITERVNRIYFEAKRETDLTRKESLKQEARSLEEFAKEMNAEADTAHKAGYKLPD